MLESWLGLMLLVLVSPSSVSTLGATICSSCSNEVLYSTPTSLPEYLPQFPPDILFNTLLNTQIKITKDESFSSNQSSLSLKPQEAVNDALAFYWKTPETTIWTGKSWLIQSDSFDCESTKSLDLSEHGKTTIDVSDGTLTTKECVAGDYTLISLHCQSNICFHKGQIYKVECSFKSTQADTPWGAGNVIIIVLLILLAATIIFFIVFIRPRMRRRRKKFQTEIIKSNESDNESDGSERLKLNNKDIAISQQTQERNSGSHGNRNYLRNGGIRGCFHKESHPAANRQTSTSSNLELLDNTDGLTVVYNHGAENSQSSEDGSDVSDRGQNTIKRLSDLQEDDVKQEGMGPPDLVSNLRDSKSDRCNIIGFTDIRPRNDDTAADWV